MYFLKRNGKLYQQLIKLNGYDSSTHHGVVSDPQLLLFHYANGQVSFNMWYI